jgi:hypothetical protein
MGRLGRSFKLAEAMHEANLSVTRNNGVRSAPLKCGCNLTQRLVTATASKKICEELPAYCPSMQYSPHRKRCLRQLFAGAVISGRSCCDTTRDRPQICDTTRTARGVTRVFAATCLSSRCLVAIRTTDRLMGGSASSVVSYRAPKRLAEAFKS